MPNRNTTESFEYTQHLFPTLPLELREYMYCYVLPPHLRSINPLLSPFHSPSHRTHDYAIFHVNRATRIDAGVYYLRSRQFELVATKSRSCFEAFLTSFPGEVGYLSVRSLELHKFYEIPDRGRDVDMRLILRCRNVRTLTLWFNSRYDNTDPDTESLFERYQLRRLFALEHIAEIQLMWFLGWRAVGDGLMMEVEDEDVLRDLCFAEELASVEEMLRMGFEEQGRRVDVRICPR
jgi:hypothetical protein